MSVPYAARGCTTSDEIEPKSSSHQYFGDDDIFEEVRDLLVKSYYEETACLSPVAAASSFEIPSPLLDAVHRWGFDRNDAVPTLEGILPQTGI
jgi:hypothetical protein